MKLLIPLFSPATGTWGGLTRITAVAEAARRAGHQVAFCASGYLEQALTRKGWQVFPTPPATMFGLPAPISRLIERRSQNASLPVKPGRDFGSIWLVLFMSGMAKAGYLKSAVAAELEAIRTFGADALFTDLDPAAFLASRAAGLPVSMAYQSPMAGGVGSLPWKLLNRAVGSVQQAYRLPDEPVDALCHGPRVMKIIPSIPELESTDPNRPDVAYVGQLLGEIQSGGFQAEDEKRCVFVYLGTGSVTLDTLRRVLPAAFPADGPHRVLVGAQSILETERIGAVTFCGYVPANDILPRCDWTVCHGGQNTIIQSLCHGIPLMVFPGPIFERRYNARQVQTRGAGRMGEIDQFTPDFIRSVLKEQESMAARAAQLKDRIASYGGAEAAVKAMEAWR